MDLKKLWKSGAAAGIIKAKKTEQQHWQFDPFLDPAVFSPDD